MRSGQWVFRNPNVYTSFSVAVATVLVCESQCVAYHSFLSVLQRWSILSSWSAMYSWKNNVNHQTLKVKKKKWFDSWLILSGLMIKIWRRGRFLNSSQLINHSKEFYLLSIVHSVADEDCLDKRSFVFRCPSAAEFWNFLVTSDILFKKCLSDSWQKTDFVVTPYRLLIIFFSIYDKNWIL